jgi:hypothetical protein
MDEMLYNVDADGQPVTRCPFTDNLVGSWGCANCIYQSWHDRKNRVVGCDYGIEPDEA